MYLHIIFMLFITILINNISRSQITNQQPKESKIMEKPSIEQLRESLSNIAWDCQGGWIGEDGVDSWSDDRVKRTSQNIISSLTKGENDE